MFKLFIPSSRPRFHVKMMIHDLINVPLELKYANHQLVLGKVGINLAEYVGLSKETGSYLLQNSKVNSLLKYHNATNWRKYELYYVSLPKQ
ncbi:hypothetical protein PCK1_000980 [Pneumocystis canis]|nr:hypothetical protein PCK1_000980 [Pneumocystis canis]